MFRAPRGANTVPVSVGAGEDGPLMRRRVQPPSIARTGDCDAVRWRDRYHRSDARIDTRFMPRGRYWIVLGAVCRLARNRVRTWCPLIGWYLANRRRLRSSKIARKLGTGNREVEQRTQIRPEPGTRASLQLFNARGRSHGLRPCSWTSLDFVQLSLYSVHFGSVPGPARTTLRPFRVRVRIVLPNS